MLVKTLRIKKKFFDAIKNGSKKKEFRDKKKFYDALFKIKPTHLKLHYQGKEKIIVGVKSIKVIPTPRIFHSTGIKFSNKCYEIDLGSVKEL